MTITFLALIITFTVVSGASNSDKVHQTPPEMIVAIASKMPTLSCSHSIQGYNRILWYKQHRNDKLLKLLGYMIATDANPEKEMAVVMSGSAEEGKNATLEIQNIIMESSAVYFCAASFHNAAY
ncbi:unnamed protein product [Gadus morhua 'NCC']